MEDIKHDAEALRAEARKDAIESQNRSGHSFCGCDVCLDLLSIRMKAFERGVLAERSRDLNNVYTLLGCFCTQCYRCVRRKDG